MSELTRHLRKGTWIHTIVSGGDCFSDDPSSAPFEAADRIESQQAELTAADEMALRLNEIINVQLSQLAASESRLTTANERYRECLTANFAVNEALTAERAISDKLEKVAAAVVERWDTPPWVFKTLRAALAEVAAMRKGEQ